MKSVRVMVLLDDPERSVMLVDRTMQSEVAEIIESLGEDYYPGADFSGLGVPIYLIGSSDQMSKLDDKYADLLVVDYGGATTGYGTDGGGATEQLLEVRKWAQDHPSSAVLIWTEFTARWYRYELEQEFTLDGVANIFFRYGHAGSIEESSSRLIGERELPVYAFHEANPTWADEVSTWLGIERPPDDEYGDDDVARATGGVQCLPDPEVTTEGETFVMEDEAGVAELKGLSVGGPQKPIAQAARDAERGRPVDSMSVKMSRSGEGETVACPLDVIHASMALQVEDSRRAPKGVPVSFKAHLGMAVGDGDYEGVSIHVNHVFGGGLQLSAGPVTVWLPLASFMYQALHAAGEHAAAEAFKSDNPTATY